MQKRILILNRFKTNNLGDQLIGESVKSIFNKYGEIYQEDIIDSFDVNEIRNPSCGVYHNLILSILRMKSKYKYYKRRLFNSAKYKLLKQRKYDYIIIGGGELINSSFSLCFTELSKTIEVYQSQSKIILYSHPA